MKYIFCEFTLIGVFLTSFLSPTWAWDGQTGKDIDNTKDKILCLQPATMPPSTAAKVLCAIARARESLHHKTFAQQSEVKIKRSLAQVDHHHSCKTYKAAPQFGVAQEY